MSTAAPGAREGHVDARLGAGPAEVARLRAIENLMILFSGLLTGTDLSKPGTGLCRRQLKTDPVSTFTCR